MGVRSEDTQLIFSAITHYRRWIGALLPTIIPDVDLSYQQINVLYYVRAEDASMADIARTLGVAPTVITGLVDRLEVRGLIRREPHSSDRRRIQLVLTDRGREISDRVEEGIATRIEQHVAALDPDQQQHLLEGLMLFEQLTTALDEQVAQENAPEGAAS